jgi:hypothetical protein
MQDAKLSSRRNFLALAATATAGLGVMAPVGSAEAPASGPATNFTRWLDNIPGQYRQLTDWPDLNSGMGFARIPDDRAGGIWCSRKPDRRGARDPA